MDSSTKDIVCDKEIDKENIDPKTSNETVIGEFRISREQQIEYFNRLPLSQSQKKELFKKLFK